MAVKWFLPEPLTVEALTWLSPDVELLAPDLLHAEVANVVWQRVQRREIRDVEARAVLTSLTATPIMLTSTGSLVAAALEISLAARIAVYDAIYLALAGAYACPLVTADRKLADRAREHDAKISIRWLGEPGLQANPR